MSKIDDLIKELCPNGVEWKKLGEVCNFQNGFAFKSKYFRDNGHAIIRITNIDNNIIDLNDVIYFDKTDYKEDLRPFEVYNGDIMVAMSGATTGKIGIYRGLDICYINQRVGAFRPKENLHNGYLYHYLTSKVNEMYILAGGGAQPNLSSTKLMSTLEIPLPPLPIQEEIVRILDKFVEQQEQLKKLIELRKKQYEYYREELLTPKEGEEWETVKIGELLEFKNGLNASKGQFGHGTLIVNYVNVYKKRSINRQDLKGLVELDSSIRSRYDVKRGDVFFTRTSETLEEIGYASVLLEDIPDGVFSGFVLRGRPISTKLYPEFCKYCFSTSMVRAQITALSTLTTRALTNGKSLSKVKLSLPNYRKQQEIADALDNFESSIADLSSALESSKARYAHYRDQLLNFKTV
ncbi:MAG: restriction endonuclease subunit S [Paludibacteraceae bacterium]|nr:restriction endonuclease subunit S [Paludibacteraceae bacterium]